MAYYSERLPGVSGLLKVTPEDFVVEEIPAYPPSGEGPHVFLTVEKRGITTQEMLRRLAHALSVPLDDLGVAGQKDKQAVARQIVSAPSPPVDLASAANLVLDGVRVLSAARHQNKLRTGHLRGNRFTITLRGVAPDAEARARAILDLLGTAWMPNRFGAQRFGMRGDNAEAGRAILRGDRVEHDRFRRRFLISAFQSELFNRYLDARMEEGALHRVMEGDVLQRTSTTGLFVCEPKDLSYNQAQLEMRQIVPTGPMYGVRMYRPGAGSVAEQREAALLAAAGADLELFARFGKLAQGSRRPLLVRVEGSTARQIGDALTLAFSLPSGSYATVLLEEIMKPGAPLDLPSDPA